MNTQNIFSEAVNLPLNEKKELIKLLIDSIGEPEQKIKNRKRWDHIGSVKLGNELDKVNIRNMAHE